MTWTQNYHGRMMNIQPPAGWDGRDLIAGRFSDLYKTGHRDARHAAAEIALEADAEIARLTATLSAVEAERDALRQKVAALYVEVAVRRWRPALKRPTDDQREPGGAAE